MFHRNFRLWIGTSDPTHRKSRVSSDKMLSGENPKPHRNFRPCVGTSDKACLYIYPVTVGSNPKTLSTPPPPLFSLPFVAISSSNHEFLKLGGSLDSPSIGDSDSVLRSSDPRGKSQRYAFKSSRSPIYQCARS